MKFIVPESSMENMEDSCLRNASLGTSFSSFSFLSKYVVKQSEMKANEFIWSLTKLSGGSLKPSTCSHMLSKESPQIPLTDWSDNFLCEIPYTVRCRNSPNLNQHLEKSCEVKYSVIQSEYIYLFDVQEMLICSVASARTWLTFHFHLDKKTQLTEIEWVLSP